jgi:hypothetical protein
MIQLISIKLRKNFEDSSIPEVIKLFKEKLQPNDTVYSVFILHFFLKISSSTDKSYYEEFLDELI